MSPLGSIVFKAGMFALLFFVISLLTKPVGGAEPWQAEWEKTVKAAKEEGQLNVYGNTQLFILNAGVFQKRYPEIKVVTVNVRGSRTVHRIQAERRAQKYIVDALTSAPLRMYQAKALDPIKPALILPEVVDESKWWLGRHRYGDREQKYIFYYIGSPARLKFSYNTNLVNSKDFKSLRDLLDPKWYGRIVTYDVRGGGPGGWPMRLIYHHPKLGPEFMRRLFGNMDITLTRDIRQATNWLATGKFSICLVCSTTDVKRAKSQGLPVEVFYFGPIEGVAGLAASGGSVSLMNKAPHPNAARVFINWLLSREGQITAQRALAENGSDALDSLRIDIPKDDVPLDNRRVEGVQYINLEDPNLRDMRPIYKLIGQAGARKR